jgi:hypothetical protein
MKITFDTKTLEKMNNYLTMNEQSSMLTVIVHYLKTGDDNYFFDDEPKLKMLWEDIKEDLDNSRISYIRWKAKQYNKV